jgi:hypothetical protein
MLGLAIKFVAKNYGDVTDLGRGLRIRSENIFAWPSPDCAITRAPGELSYALFIGPICAHY